MQKHNSSIQKSVFSLFLIFSLCIFSLNANDWGIWRGENQTGISSEKKWKPSGVSKKLWKINVGVGYSSVATKGKYCYTLGWKNGQDTVVCINSEKGSIEWSFSYKCSKGGGFAGPRATPVIDGDYIYTFSNEGHLHCLSLKDGTKKWVAKVTDHGAQNIQWGFSSPPYIQDGLVVVNAGKAGMAFNKKSGEKVWGEGGKCSYASPIPFKFKKKDALAIFGQKHLHAVDFKTGKIHWSYPWETSYDVNAADPIILGNKIFISSAYNKGSALIDFSSGKPKEVWKTTDMRNHFSSSILLPKSKGVLIGSDGNTGKGKLVAINLKNGKQVWSQKTQFASLFYAGDKLICLNEKGLISIGKVDSKGFKPSSSAQLDNGGKYWSMPILSHAKLYCRGSNGLLTCLDMK